MTPRSGTCNRVSKRGGCAGRARRRLAACRSHRRCDRQCLTVEGIIVRVTVNRTDLWFDTEGVALVPDGITMRERPIVLALHGGPGLDHAYFKPFLTPLTTFAQLIYL